MSIKRRYALGLIAIFLLLVISNIIWFDIDTRLTDQESSNFLVKGITAYNFIKNSDNPLSLDMTSSLFNVDPPLVPLSIAGFHFLFSPSEDTAIMINALFLFILIFSVYGIGTQLFNKQVGFYSVITLLAFPIFLHFLMRSSHPELYIMSMGSLCVYLALKSDYFRDFKYSILLGLALGLTALVKESFSLYLLIPFSIIILKSFWINRKSFVLDKTNFINLKDSLIIKWFWLWNLSSTFLIGVIIASFWYLNNLSSSIGHYFYAESNLVQGYAEMFSFLNLSHYFLLTMNYHVGFILFLTAGVILGVSFWKGKPLKKMSALALFTSLLVPYLILTFMQKKGETLFLPLLPVFAIIISSGICRLKINLKRFFIILISILFIIQALWFIPYPPLELAITKELDGVELVNTIPLEIIVFNLPKNGKFPSVYISPDTSPNRVKKVSNLIYEDWNPNKENAKILLVIHHYSQYFNYDNFRYYSELENSNLEFFHLWGDLSNTESFSLENADYIIYSSSALKNPNDIFSDLIVETAVKIDSEGLGEEFELITNGTIKKDHSFVDDDTDYIVFKKVRV